MVAVDRGNLTSETERLAAIVRVQQEISRSGFDLDHVLELVVRRAKELTNAAAAVVEMAEGDDMVYRAASGTSAIHVGLRLKRETSISGLCVRTGEMLRCDDSETDPRVDREACRRVGARSMVVVPLMERGTTLGVLKVMSPNPAAFTGVDEHTLSLLASQITVALTTASAMTAQRDLLLARTAALAEVRESQERLQTLVNKAPIGICIINAAGTMEELNIAFAALLGYTVRELVGRPVQTILAPDTVQEVLAQREGTVARREDVLGEYEFWTKEGRSLTVLASSTPFGSDEDDPKRVAFSVDITGQKNAERALFHLVHHDTLTGLPNRLLMTDRLKQMMSQATRNGDALAVLWIDLDGFKEVNDTHGHLAGDRVLEEVSVRLQACVRGADTVARLGGDEFVVLLGSLRAPAGGETVATKIIERMCEPILLESGPAIVHASVGIALFPSDGSDADTLLHHADQAMYRAKRAGKGQFVTFSPAAE